MAFNPYQVPNAEVIAPTQWRGVNLAKRLSAFILLAIFLLSLGVILPRGLVISILFFNLLQNGQELAQGLWTLLEFLAFYSFVCSLSWLIYRSLRVVFGMGWAIAPGSRRLNYLPGKFFWFVSLSAPIGLLFFYLVSVLEISY